MDFYKTEKYCINLPHRKDRKQKVLDEFKKHCIEVKIWKATDGKKHKIPDDSPKLDQYNRHGILGCMLSHRSLIQHAKDNNLEYIAVFEDDIILCENFNDIIEKLKYLNFDMFYLGGHFNDYKDDIEKISGQVHKCISVGGTYAYVAKNTIYDYILENMDYKYGADEFYGDILQKKFNCLAIIPFAVNHDVTYSDIALSSANYGTSRFFNKYKIKYITFNSLEKYGRLGNQLFEIASVIGLAEKYGATPIFPTKWKYRNYFNGPDEYFADMEYKEQIIEKVFHYIPNLLHGIKSDIVDVKGTLQSEKYFIEIRDKIREYLTPIGIDKYDKWSVGIHIRRGDYVNNPNYVHYGAEYYYSVILKYFNDKKYKFYVCSEDYEYCKEHFIGKQFIVEKRTEIEDFRILCSCRNLIIPNSTFSWWAAYIGQQKIVIRPPKIFDGKLAETHSEKDYWINKWIIHDEKIYLKDLTFIIPVSYDHPDRIENLKIVTSWIKKCFDTTIIIGEQGGKYFKEFGDKYISFPYKDFHRTRMLNRMTMLAETPYVINWDADVLVSVKDILEMMDMLKGEYDFVYPYDGRFIRVGDGTYARNKNMIEKLKEGDIGNVCTYDFVGKVKDGYGSLGGAIGYKKESFIKAGMENEAFIAYNPEDVERFYRFKKLGYKIGRTSGALYHLNHYCGDNSTVKNKYYQKGIEELKRIKSMETPIIEADITQMVLITYSDENYEEYQKRLVSHADESGMFDNIFRYNREWLERTKFYEDNKHILNEERGGGLWLWKPYIILQTMKQVSQGTIILYMDCGDIFDGDIRSFLINVREDILLTRGTYKNKEWTKRDCFIKMGCDEKKYHDVIQLEAGVIILKNTIRTKAFIVEWLGYCEDKQILSFEKSIIKKEYSGLKEHRNDQSILTNLKVKYNIKSSNEIRNYITCNIPLEIKPTIKIKESENRYDATDVTFVIPVKCECRERKENLEIVIWFLKKYFDTNIIIGEQGGNHFEYMSNFIEYINYDLPLFYRTKIINNLILEADTEIVFNWDADVIMNPEQIINAIEMIRNDSVIVYPYDNFVRIRNDYYEIKNIINSKFDFKELIIENVNSVGGAIGYRKKIFIESGMENENIINWGFEDVERYSRYKILGYKIDKIIGEIYHIEHPKLSQTHPYLTVNKAEYRKVREMNKSDLLAYIQQWKWVLK